MQGFPGYFNTNVDYDNAQALALAGSAAERQTMIGQWQALLNSAKVWSFQGAVAADYAPAQDEQVMTNQQDGETTYSLFRKIDGPESRMLQLGLSVEVIEAKIAELGGAA